MMIANIGTALAVAVTAAMPAAAPLPPEPKLFAPGVISGPANDGAPTFTPDGRTLYFERTNGRYSAILESRRRGRGWSTAQLANFSGPSSDQQPALSPDGKTLVFVSSRLQAGGGAASHLWAVRRAPFGWSAPIELPPAVNISRRVFKPSLAANGDLYFMADLDTATASPPHWRLYRSEMRDGAYQGAKPLSFSDGTFPDVDPAIAPDQSYLVFSSRGRRAGDPFEHLFISFRKGEGWGAVLPMRYQGDNDGADDGEAQISPDGKTLYFISGRTLPLPPPAVRTRADAEAVVARMALWDNSNTNVWTLPLSAYLVMR